MDTVLSFHCGIVDKLGGFSSRKVAWVGNVKEVGMELGSGSRKVKVH